MYWLRLGESVTVVLDGELRDGKVMIDMARLRGVVCVDMVMSGMAR